MSMGSGDLEDLCHCLKADTDSVNTPDLWGRRPMYYAIRSKNVVAIKLLYEHGAFLTVTNKISGNDEDLMITAFKTASNETVQCLISLLSTTTVGQCHIRHNLSLYLPYLFRGDASLLKNFTNSFKIHSLKGQESVFCKTSKKCHYDTMIRYNVCFDLQSALRYTLVYGRYSAFEYLLTLVRYGEQLDYIYRGPHGSQHTLLSICVANGYYKGLIHLVQGGANMNIVSVNEHGETRNNLMAAVDNRQYQYLKDRDQIMVQRCVHYLARFYNIDDQNSRGQTALMFANRVGNTDLVKILLELGADPNIADMNGQYFYGY